MGGNPGLDASGNEEAAGYVLEIEGCRAGGGKWDGPIAGPFLCQSEEETERPAVAGDLPGD